MGDRCQVEPAFSIEPQGGRWLWKWTDPDNNTLIMSGVEDSEEDAWTRATIRLLQRNNELMGELVAKAEAAERRATDAEAALKQAQDDALVLAADCINVVEAEYNVHVFLSARRFSAPDVEAMTRLARKTNTSERVGPALRRVLAAATTPKETS